MRDLNPYAHAKAAEARKIDAFRRGDLRQLTKPELQAMLAQAAQNTANQPRRQPSK